jgi:predicted MFS family arabinose efflux permease
MTLVNPARPWLVLFGLALGVCVNNGFARFAYGVILPAMKQDLGWSYAQAGWLNTANALGYIVGAIVTLWLITRFSPSRLFSLGVITTAFFLLFTGLTDALWAQSLWRILAGVFGAISFIAGGALAAALFPDNPKSNALAIALYFGFGGGLGIVLSGAALPLMLEGWGPSSWPYAWITVGITCLVFTPPSVWAAEQLRPPTSKFPARESVPTFRMLGVMGGYAGFGMGYIVYLTFLVAWMRAHDFSAGMVSGVWVLLGTGISLSPFVWRSVFARFASGLPLAMILTCIAIGSVLPVLMPTATGLILSAIIFGLSVFMSPGAITNFTRQNLPAASWGPALTQFTIVFAFAQTISPIAAGLIGDMTGDIGDSILVAAGVLLLGAVCALMQKPLRDM